ncbi:MAG TPA: N(4)-(beta-N-acetylglucosaminyl)-L-asparaginase [Vicinamibacteria bacterium]|jgi:N4-(beta-N-acetylglucosaminyl)-L-asparaginase
MSDSISRRQFVKTGAAASVAAGLASAATGQGPSVLVRKATPPVVIASSNGHEHKNGGARTCVEEAWQRIAKGEDVLESLIAGVNIVELDPADTSVGYGGLPNADGVVQLDSCCMHGPSKRAGGVASLEGVRTPSRVAKMVLDHTDHHLLVGPGAQGFARNMGFSIEADLNTERSRAKWLEWKRRIDPKHYLDPKQRSQAGEAASRSMVREGLLDPHHRFGTINCDGVSAKGEVCGVTTTSGLAFKIPGRVGDSPILGAGLWVDDAFGAAGSTGRGEANLYNLSSFLIVEELRRGKAAKDAGMEALRRVKAATVEKRLLDRDGRPAFQLVFYVLTKKGEYAGVSMWGEEDGKPERFAVCTDAGPALVACEPLHEGAPAD